MVRSGSQVAPSVLVTTADLAMLRHEIDTLARRLETVERWVQAHGTGPRDGADVALLHVLAATARGLSFTAAGMWRRRAVDPTLAEALLAADITSARQLGKLLRRLTGHTVDGWCLRRVGTNREGAVLQLWQE
jgi:hypothetical protein